MNQKSEKDKSFILDKINQRGENAEKKQDSQELWPPYFRELANTRTINFCLQKGIMQFFEYAYLVTVLYKVKDQVLEFIFTSHIVVVEGHNLDKIYQCAQEHSLAELCELDGSYYERYSQVFNSNEEPPFPYVTTIKIRINEKGNTLAREDNSTGKPRT